MQCSNPNDFQTMEEMSCIHLPSPENLACRYQMLQSVERTDGNWQHVISFQWIGVLPAGYYFLSTPVDFALWFSSFVVFQTLLPRPISLMQAQTGLWLISWCWRVAEWLSQREKRSKMEGDSLDMQLPYHTCHMTGHDLINGEEN